MSNFETLQETNNKIGNNYSQIHVVTMTLCFAITKRKMTNKIERKIALGYGLKS